MAHSNWGIGIIGLGGIANVHLEAYRKTGLTVMGGSDINAQRAEEMKQKWGLPFVTTDNERLISHPEVKILDITAPHYFSVREPIFRLAAQYKKAVFVQKPLDQYYEQAKKLVEIAESAGIPLMVNQNSVFVPAFRAMEPYLQQGTIGTPYYCQIENRAWSDASAHSHFGKYERWVLSDMGVHHYALIIHWFGRWQSVYALIGRDPSQAGVVGDTWNIVNVRFESGVQACVINNWCYRGNRPRPHSSEEIVIQGEKGAITATSEEVVIVSTEPPAEIRPRFSGKWFPDAFANAMHHFIDSLEKGEQPLCSGRQNLQVMALIEGAYRSVQERREVLCEEMMDIE